MITKSICNHCKEIVNAEDWIELGGGCIKCPKCLKDIMCISFTTPVKGGCDCCAHKFEKNAVADCVKKEVKG